MGFDPVLKLVTLWVILAPARRQRPEQDGPETLATLTNREVIAVDQNKLGKQGYRVSATGRSKSGRNPSAEAPKPSPSSTAENPPAPFLLN